jgi:membrane fusion protein (multidrug efflux system)
VPHLYAITAGLKEGEKILVEGLRKVKNGQEIKCDFVDQHRIVAELNRLHAE